MPFLILQSYGPTGPQFRKVCSPTTIRPVCRPEFLHSELAVHRTGVGVCDRRMVPMPYEGQGPALILELVTPKNTPQGRTPRWFKDQGNTWVRLDL